MSDEHHGEPVSGSETGAGSGSIELSIVMPCLDEAETVGACVTQACEWLSANGVDGEVIVADNGSTDDSVALAEAAGARVVHVDQRGYGAAVAAGIEAARGTYVITGDADQSYDFGNLGPFLDELRDGADVVIGDRFAGGIAPGAMPWLHRYIGNPGLSFAGRLLFRVPVHDFHCGLRGMRRSSLLDLGLRSRAFEYTSETIIRAGMAGYDIRNTPTTLVPDGRSRRPHLRTWTDGWGTLRFLLLYSPRWLFLYPGLLLFALGLGLTSALVAGPVGVGSIELDLSALVYAAGATTIGYQAVMFALFAKVYGRSAGWFPPDARLDRFGDRFRLERGLALGAAIIALGAVLAFVSFWRWEDAGWGELDPSQQLRYVVPAALGLVLGASTVLASLFLSILGVDRRIDL